MSLNKQNKTGNGAPVETPDGLLGLHYDWFSYRGLDIRFAVRAGDSNEPPLLIFNGIGQNIEVLRPLIRALPDRRIITYDVPGTGSSDTPLLPWRFSEHARLAMNLLQSLNVNEASILGISWGGSLAQQFARRYPTHTTRLILAATGPGQIMVPGRISAYFRMANLRRFWDPGYLDSVSEHIYGGSVREDASHLEGHGRRSRAPSRRGYFYQALALVGWSSLPWLRKLQQPTLVIHGDADPLIPELNARLMTALLPNARLEVIDCGHLFLLTRLEKIVPLIDGFLRSPGASETVDGELVGQ